MPQSVHKMLIHSSQVVRDKPVPVGLLSDEAQESRNKDVNNYREHYTRKFSRKVTKMLYEDYCAVQITYWLSKKELGCIIEPELKEDCIKLLL